MAFLADIPLSPLMSAPAASAAAAGAASLAALSGARVWVSGASGFLGGAIVQRLLELGVREVRAIGRSAAARAKITALGATAVDADLSGDTESDVAQLTASMRDCDVAIHSAAFVGDFGDYDATFKRTNVDGTARVLEACRAAGVARLVHVSTEAVLVDDRHLPLHNATEEMEMRGLKASTNYPYSKSKAEAEAMVIAANNSETSDGSNKLTTVAVRPRLIWGKGDTVIFPRLADMARKGLLVYLGNPEALTSTCNVHNVVEGALLAAVASADVVGGKSYFLTDPFPPLTVRAAWTTWLATHDLPAPSRSIPFGLAMAAAALMENGSWVLRKLGLAKEVAPLVTRQAIALLGQDMTVDASRARKELGYVGHCSFELGVAEMKEEFQQQQQQQQEAAKQNQPSAK
jgi:nucleoside-diphosphate-sugar epimerase